MSLRCDYLRVPWHVAQYLCNNVVGRNAFGFRFEIQTQPMPQCGSRDGLDIIKAHVETPLGQRANFACQY